MAVLGAALQVDAAAELVAGGHPVVAVQPQPAEFVAVAVAAQLAEHGCRVDRVVAGGADQHVRVEYGGLPGDQRLDGDLYAVRVRHGGTQPGGVEQPQPGLAEHLFPVAAPVQLGDQVAVHHGVVGVAVVVHELGLHVGGRVEVVVDGARVEDPVGERAVVGRAVAVAGEDRADLGVGEPLVQVRGDLGGALSGADDHEPRRCRAGTTGEVEQQVAAVPDPVVGDDTGRQPGRETGGEYEVAGPMHGGALAGVDQHVDQLDAVLGGHRAYADHLVAVPDQVVHLGSGPFEVVVVLDPQRVERLVVDEVDQPALGVQVGQETEPAGGVAQRHQVLEERDLHCRVVQQHAPVPAEALLSFEEDRAHRPFRLVRSGCSGLFGQGDGQGQVGRPEPHSDDVVNRHLVMRRYVRHGPHP